MDTTVIISDYLDNSNIDNFEALFVMADDYKYQLLMQELNEKINIDSPESDLPF